MLKISPEVGWQQLSRKVVLNAPVDSLNTCIHDGACGANCERTAELRSRGIESTRLLVHNQLAGLPFTIKNMAVTKICGKFRSPLQPELGVDDAKKIGRRRFIERAGGVASILGLAGPAISGQGNKAQGEMMVKRVHAGVLETAYVESGPADGSPIVLLHGFPYDVHSYDVAAERLAAAGRRVIVPYLRGYGPTRFLREDTPRVGQQAALGSDLLALLDALSIQRATLAGYDWGGRAACVVAALWPERVSGLVSCGSGYNLQNSAEALEPIDPEKERLHWYWFYFNSERGRAALTQNRDAFLRYLWKDFSPTWRFDDAAYAQTASSFINPDFVDVVLHSYRYRIGAVTGDEGLKALEERLSTPPKISVPTIVLEGADDGVDPPASPEKVKPHFSDLRHLTTLKNAGHNVPQEAPDTFASAVLELGNHA